MSGSATCWPARHKLTVGTTAREASQSSWFGWLGAKDTKAAHDKARVTSEIEACQPPRPVSDIATAGKASATAVSSRRSSSQAMVSRGCHQQARPRAPQKRALSLATTVKTARPPRNKAHDSTIPLPSEKHEASQPRDETRVRMTRERQTHLSKQTKPLPPPRYNCPHRGGARQKANGPKRPTGEARRYFRQDSQRSDASHSERRQDLCWSRQGR